MRRRREDVSPVPEELARFAPEDWAIDMGEALERWRAARASWLAEHPEVDSVEFLAAGRAERRRHLPRPAVES